MNKCVASSGWTYNDEICLSALILRIYFVIHPDISLRQLPSCVREKWVFAVDNDMNTWVSSTYKR